MPATSLTVGGELTWDVIISIGASIVAALAAYYGLKGKVENLKLTVNSLEDAMDDMGNNFRNMEREFRSEIEVKRTAIIGEMENIKSELYNLKETTHKELLNDINKLESNIKKDVNSLDVKMEKLVNKYDTYLTELESRILNRFQIEQKSLNEKHENDIKAVFRRIDELRNLVEKINLEVKELSITITSLERSLVAVDDKNKLTIENIHTIIDFLKSDLENLKQYINFSQSAS